MFDIGAFQTVQHPPGHHECIWEIPLTKMVIESEFTTQANTWDPWGLPGGTANSEIGRQGNCSAVGFTGVRCGGYSVKSCG